MKFDRKDRKDTRTLAFEYRVIVNAHARVYCPILPTRSILKG